MGERESSDCLRCSLLQSCTWPHQIVRVVHYYNRERDFMRLTTLFLLKMGTIIIRLSALFIMTNRKYLHQIVCSVHYYKWERDFIRLSALLDNTKGNVNLSECQRCSLLKMWTCLHVFVLRCSLLQKWPWLLQIACLFHYYKVLLEFIRLSALFIITKGIANSSECMRCSLLQMRTWFHQFVCVIH